MDFSKALTFARNLPAHLQTVVDAGRRALPVAREALAHADELLAGIEALTSLGKAAKGGGGLKIHVRLEHDGEEPQGRGVPR